jgi:hypothetical protein
MRNQCETDDDGCGRRGQMPYRRGRYNDASRMIEEAVEADLYRERGQMRIPVSPRFRFVTPGPATYGEMTRSCESTAPTTVVQDEAKTDAQQPP